MWVNVVSWNSLGINADSDPYQTTIQPVQMANITRNPVLVNRSGEYPFLSGAVKNPSTLVLRIDVRPGNNINTYREQLKKYFFSDDNKHNLVIEDKNDSNRQYYRSGIPTMLIGSANDEPSTFMVTIQTDYPYWQLVTAVSDSWAISASGDSNDVTNIGNIPVPPVFTITPTVTKTTGLKYRRYVPIYNNTDKTYISTLDLTNGGLDVQALIDANKMQVDGDDFRWWHDGAFGDRWLNGVDSDATPAKLWTSNYKMSPRTEGITSTLFDSDDTTILFNHTRDNLDFLRKLKIVANPVLQVDASSDSDSAIEFICFDPDNIDILNYQITSVTRNEKDSTAVPHLAGVTVRHIEHDDWMLYGDSDMTAQDVDDRYKPLLNLANSLNSKWYWSPNATFYDADNDRPGAWKPEVLSSRTGLSYNYTDFENAFVNPAETMGLALVGSSDFQVQNESAVLDWIFTHPARMETISYDGFKYSTGSFPAICGLQYLQPGVAWFTLSNEDIPVDSDLFTWVYFDHSADSDAISIGGYNTIRFAVDGLLSSVIDEAALADFYVYWVSFDSDDIPAVNPQSEASVNFFDFKLTNGATNEYILVQTPCKLNQPLTIDCVNKQAYLADGARVNVILSSDRAEWLNLAPGTNPFNYVDVGTVGVNIVISHRDRVL